MVACVQVTPLACQVQLVLSPHKEGGLVRGLRWLGQTPRLLTFTSDRASSAASGSGGGSGGGGGGGGGGAGAGPGGGWRNQVAITDLRTRRTSAFR